MKHYAKTFEYRLNDEPHTYHAYFAPRFVPVAQVVLEFLNYFENRLLSIRPIGVII